MDDYLATGVIRTSHGIRGYVKVSLFSDDTEAFLRLDSVLLRKGSSRVTTAIEDAQWRGRDLLVKFAVIDSPETGKQYSGWEIWIPREKAAELGEQEFYAAEIVGCELFAGGHRVGSVTSIIEGTQAPLLEISVDDGIRLIPFMKEYIGDVDIAEKRIVLLDERLLT